MRFQLTPSKLKYKWHKVFAFFPHFCGDTIVWLEYCERRMETGYDGIWEYRLLEKTDVDMG